MRALLLGGGVIVLLAGMLFLGQGSGVFPYPRSSFMVGQAVWGYRGVSLATLGCTMILLSRIVGHRRP